MCSNINCNKDCFVFIYIFSIPGLNLKYLEEADNYVFKPIQIADYPLHSGRDSARTDVR